MPSEIAEIKNTRQQANSDPGAAAVAALLRDKTWWDGLMAGAGIPAPTTHGIADPDGYLAMRPASLYPLPAVAGLLDGLQVFCKPPRSKGGAGSFSAIFDGGKAVVDGHTLTGDEFAELLAERSGGRGKTRGSRRLIIQQRVANAPEVAELYDGSVNTLRLLTHTRADKPQVFSAVLRIGAGGSSVDNWDAGGLVVPVDPERGVTRGDGIRKRDRAKLRHHPDTGADLRRVKLPHFDAARQLVTTAHRLIPDLATVGWDVALAPGGPMLLEANSKWDITMHQLTHPGFHRLVMRILSER